jgi:hypothetical protein
VGGGEGDIGLAGASSAVDRRGQRRIPPSDRVGFSTPAGGRRIFPGGEAVTGGHGV